MRILHLNDRLSRRGGADLHLLGVIDDLKSVAQQCLAYGRRDDGLELDIETASVGGLDARTPRPCSLQELFHSYRPDVVHVHNVMNPKALVQAADWGAMMTVQDHRTFCPGRGKQKLDGSVCREVQSKDLCRSCFTEDSYFEEIWDLTQERMDALKRMKAVVVLSDYMKNELIQAGVQKPEIMSSLLSSMALTLVPKTPRSPVFFLWVDWWPRKAFRMWCARGSWPKQIYRL